MLGSLNRHLETNATNENLKKNSLRIFFSYTAIFNFQRSEIVFTNNKKARVNITKCTIRKKILLKGPKREIFDSGFFALIRPIWIGDLGTRPKNYKF